MATARLRLTACGALEQKLLTIINQLPPDVAELTCFPAAWHNHPEKIVPGIKAKFEAARKAGFSTFVIDGDCGTGGQLDVLLNGENVARVPGPHCYQSFMDKTDFDAAMDQELGTFS